MNGGKKRYYSTGDIYPWIQQNKKGPTHQECTKSGRYHNITTCKNVTAALEWGTPDWDGINGAWRGLDWLAQMLPSQIATGDVVWSPFVAAGWSEMEELNTRPAQWIGLLKLLAVSGAEFFYAGFFNLHPAFPDPRNWCWQGAAPAYVQAITSHYLDVPTPLKKSLHFATHLTFIRLKTHPVRANCTHYIRTHIHTLHTYRYIHT
jgi:hypothetical protein